MKKIILSTLFIFLLSACTREIVRVEPDRIRDGLYDSEFPSDPTSAEIEEVMKAIKLLSTIAFYESYEFDRESKITEDQINDDLIEEKSVSKYHFNQPATGTATVVYRQHRQVALLTCAHIVFFPDTVIAYFRDDDGRETEHIQTLAFKIRQNINIIDFHLGGDFKILAMDQERDIAIIGKHLKVDTPFSVPVFKHRRGAAEELNWGSFVYVIGFPRGEKMITRAIVSRPSRDKDDTFVIDAVFNRGFSGGIVLAVRDGMPNFELVGMAKSVPAETKLYLAPQHSIRILETSPQDEYKGDIKVQSHENIFYGITYVVTSEAIQRFIEKNASILEDNDFYPELFFPVK